MGKQSGGKRKKTNVVTVEKTLQNRKIGGEQQNISEGDSGSSNMEEVRSKAGQVPDLNVNNDECVSVHTASISSESSDEDELQVKDDFIFPPLESGQVLGSGINKVQNLNGEGNKSHGAPVSDVPVPDVPVPDSNSPKKMYVDMVSGISVKRKVNFRYIPSDDVLEEGVDVAIPVSSVHEATKRYGNTLYGYFIGKRVAFHVVQNYVTNVWKKYGIEKFMMNSRGFFFFKFSTEKGMMDVLENGPWMIRTVPIILNKWSPNVCLTKAEVNTVPVLIKLHDIPLAGFTEDGLSYIASKVGKPLMLDSYTSTMCMESWGIPNYARAMIEVAADCGLKESLRVATPSLDGGGSTIDVVKVEYEWKPPHCPQCKIFGHKEIQYPKNVSVVPNKKAQDDGFQIVAKKVGSTDAKKDDGQKGFMLSKNKPKMIYRQVTMVNDGNRVDKAAGSSTSQNPKKVVLHNSYSVLNNIPEGNEKLKSVYEGLVDEDSDVDLDMVEGASK